MPEFKAGVVVYPPLHAKLEAAIELIDRAHIRIVKTRPALITAARDGVHLPTSYHYAGKAIDLRSNDLAPQIKDILYEELKDVLGNDFKVLFESRGKPNEHFHIQCMNCP